jgi:hypothetical protein
MTRFDLSRFFRIQLRYWLAAAVAVLCVGAVTIQKPLNVPIQRPIFRIQAGAVRGAVYAQLGTQNILVTDFPVFLKNAATNAPSAPVLTDRFGHYYFRSQLNGDYHVCWSAPGWAAGCAEPLVQIRGNLSFVDPLRVFPQRALLIAGPFGAPVWGRVALADGSSPWFFNPYFGVRQDVAVVAQAAGSNTSVTVNTNAQGQFVFPYLPNGTYQLTAKAGGGTGAISVTAGKGNPVTITIKDRRPVIAAITTKLAGQVRQEVPASGTLDVSGDITDADGDPIKITWKLATANGSLSTTSGPTTTWTLPGETGVKTLYVMANDGRGGIVVDSTGVSAGSNSTYFGVSLYDTSAQKIVTNARVTVNGTAAAVTGKGLFVARAPITNRYVVNASAPGYIFMSRIYGHGGVYHEMHLVRPALGTMDAGRTTTITDTRDPKTLRMYHYLEGARASITIRGGTLIRPDHSHASGTLSTEIAALDISSEQFPGDDGAMVNGKDEGLISYGAVGMEIRDAAGTRLQLAPGQMADVTIPVPYTMHNPPATIPLWSYNETTGFWEALPNGATYSPSLGAYKASVPHLSAFNVDLNQADLACFRVLLDDVATGQLKARVTPVSGETFPDTGFFEIHDTLNVIKRLPPNATVNLQIGDNAGNIVDGLEIFDDTQNLTGQVGSTATSTITNANVQTGPATLPHYPDLPYSNCRLFSVRFNAALAASNGLSFLDIYGDIGTSTGAADYYHHLDSGVVADGGGTGTYHGGNHGTLGDFWNLGGFGADGKQGAPAHASYLNYNDLGFGRDMWIRKTDATHVYAYVVNYTKTDHKPDQNPLNAVYAQTEDPAHVYGTVAMEATDFGGMTKVVKFWVYGGNQSTSKLQDNADLDGFGPKFVPQLCQACHGGKPLASPSSNTDYALRTAAGAVGAVLREFDLATFVYPGAPTWTVGDPVPIPPAGLGDYASLSSTDKTQYFNLNQLVIASGTQPAMQDLINGFNPSALTFNPAWVPSGSGWDDASTKQTFYSNVVAKSCRTCHISFDPTSVPFNTLNWQIYSQFTGRHSTINFAVCGSSKYMPHALMTYRNFWLEGMGAPYEPDALAGFSTPEWTPLGTCK